LKIFRTRFSTI